jgi:hypothetical protein
VVERKVELVDGARSESVADLRPVDRDPHSAVRQSSVVCDVFEREALYGSPCSRVEQLGYNALVRHATETTATEIVDRDRGTKEG